MSLIKPNKAIAPDEAEPMIWDKLGSPKLDGIRSLLQSNDAYTKSMKFIPNLELREMASQVSNLDGEFIYGQPNAPDVYNKTYSAVMTIKGTAENVTFYAFDYLDLALPFEQRYERLLGSSLPGWVKVVPQVPIKSREDYDALVTRHLEEGYEGTMLRNRLALYKQGRSTAKSQDLLKIKPFLDSEAIVLEVFEAQTNNNEAFTNEAGYTARSTHQENLEGKGMAGGFVVQQGAKVFRISAGSLTHEERIEVWLNRHKYVGRLCVFRHMPYGEKDVPRHGRFKGWRSPLDM